MLKQKQVKFLSHASLTDLTSSGLNTPEFSYITGENAFYTKIGGVNTLIGGGKFWGLNGNAGTNPSLNYIGTSDAQDFIVRTNATERMRVKSSGEVGIGAITPYAKLSVADNNNKFATTIQANSAASVLGLGNDGFPCIQSFANTGFVTYTGLLLNPKGGNVGVGVLSATNKLHVAGNIRIVDGTEGTNKVLTSDANGVGTWQTPSSFTVYGSYDDDTDAAANGVPIDGVYEYSSTNTEGMPEGVLKRRKN